MNWYVKVLNLPSKAESLVVDLENMRDGREDELGSLLKRAIDTIVLLSAKKVVTGTLEGGVLSLDEVPDGVDVEINDYDVSGDEENLEDDEAGRTFSPCRWGA